MSSRAEGALTNVASLARALRADGRVEIGERLPMDLLREDREIGAQLLRVERGSCRHGHRAIVPRHRVMKFLSIGGFLVFACVFVAGCGGSGGSSSSTGGEK